MIYFIQLSRMETHMVFVILQELWQSVLGLFMFLNYNSSASRTLTSSSYWKRISRTTWKLSGLDHKTDFSLLFLPLCIQVRICIFINGTVLVFFKQAPGHGVQPSTAKKMFQGQILNKLQPSSYKKWGQKALNSGKQFYLQRGEE